MGIVLSFKNLSELKISKLTVKRHKCTLALIIEL